MYKAILPLCLISCSSWSEDSVAYVWIDDPNNLLSESQEELIHNSLSEWQDAVDDYVTFETVYGKGYKSMIIIRADSFANMHASGNDAVAEIVPWERGGAITIPFDVDDNSLRALLLHEIGHTLGLDHDVPGTIMVRPASDASRDITCRDVEQFCEVNDCNSNSMTICNQDK